MSAKRLLKYAGGAVLALIVIDLIAAAATVYLGSRMMKP